MTRFSQELLDGIERIEDLTEQKAAIDRAISEAKQRLKKRGFDMNCVTQCIKDRKLSKEERQSRDGRLQIYRAALNLLDDMPLGEFARRQLDRKNDPAPPPEDQDDNDKDNDPHKPSGDSPSDPASSLPPPAPVNLELAREQGREACRAGQRVVENPYPAGDPQRAAWDEGWCEESGSDGMEIPKAWRRDDKPKPKKED